MHEVYQQLGEVLSSVRSLGELMEVRSAQSDQLHEILRADLSVLRHDQHDLEEKLECVICVMQHDLEALRIEVAAAGRAMDALVIVVRDIQVPVADIVRLRSRIAGILLTVGVVGSAVLWLAEPFYRWLVDRLIKAG